LDFIPTKLPSRIKIFEWYKKTLPQGREMRVFIRVAVPSPPFHEVMRTPYLEGDLAYSIWISEPYLTLNHPN